MTRITDRKISCVYIHVYHIIKIWGTGPYNSLYYDDKRKHFSGFFLTWNRREAHMLYLAREVGKIWRCSCWAKSNFIMINEFNYGQTLKMWICSLSLSIYSTFKDSKMEVFLENFAKSSLQLLFFKKKKKKCKGFVN